MSKINWTVRVKNPLFWAQVAVGVLSPILVGLGLQWEDMTTWAALGEALRRAVLNPVIVVAVVVSLWGVVTDPTTAGMGDSSQALSYTEPKKDEV
ncbi:MAG: phage holin [Acutalibacter sp.]|jgi:phi LC3 family holin